jgi:choline kinase
VIAAAGLGSRLGHGLPKCMLQVEGRTVLSRLIDAIRPHTDRIHVVVGYREELVVEHCALYHRDVVLVRNPDFRINNTLTSLSLGARGLRGQLLFVDGDTIVRQHTLEAFVSRGKRCPTLIGVTHASSEDAVFVSTSGDGDSLQVESFSRESQGAFEWANLMLAPSELASQGDGFVFQAIEPLLPLPASIVEVVEIDTENDLAAAQASVRRWDATP